MELHLAFCCEHRSAYLLQFSISEFSDGYPCKHTPRMKYECQRVKLLTRMMANNPQENYSDVNGKSGVTLTLG